MSVRRLLLILLVTFVLGLSVTPAFGGWMNPSGSQPLTAGGVTPQEQGTWLGNASTPCHQCKSTSPIHH